MLQLRRSLPESGEDGIDFVPGPPEAVIELLSQTLSGGSLLFMQRPLVGIKLSALRRQMGALGLKPFALGVECTPVLVDPSQMVGQLGLALAATCSSCLDNRGGDAKPGRDLECKAAARRSVRQPVVRGERLRVEPEPGARDTGCRRGVRLQHVVVRCRYDQCPAGLEVFNDCCPKRTSFHRVGTRPDFVEEDERREVEAPVHRHDIHDVA